MKRTIIALALALPGCGDGSEAKLDQCKAEMRAEFQRSTDMARQEGDKTAKELSKSSGDPLLKDANDKLSKWHEDMRKSMEDAVAKAGPALEAQMKTWQGAAGLATCEKALAASRQLSDHLQEYLR